MSSLCHSNLCKRHLLEREPRWAYIDIKSKCWTKTRIVFQTDRCLNEWWCIRKHELHGIMELMYKLCILRQLCRMLLNILSPSWKLDAVVRCKLTRKHIHNIFLPYSDGWWFIRSEFAIEKTHPRCIGLVFWSCGQRTDKRIRRIYNPVSRNLVCFRSQNIHRGNQGVSDTKCRHSICRATEESVQLLHDQQFLCKRANPRVEAAEQSPYPLFTPSAPQNHYTDEITNSWSTPNSLTELTLSSSIKISPITGCVLFYLFIYFFIHVAFINRVIPYTRVSIHCM